MIKIMDCTNRHGIVRTTVNDDQVTVEMIYDTTGDKYKQVIPFPHKVKGYPALRGRWSFQTKT